MMFSATTILKSAKAVVDWKRESEGRNISVRWSVHHRASKTTSKISPESLPLYKW